MNQRKEREPREGGKREREMKGRSIRRENGEDKEKREKGGRERGTKGGKKKPSTYWHSIINS